MSLVNVPKKSIIIAAFAALMVLSCSKEDLSFEKASSFRLRALGTYLAPDAATGTEAPQSISVNLNAVRLRVASDGTFKSLLSGGTKSYRVIDRPQLLLESSDTSELDGTEFSQVSVTLDPAIKVTTADGTVIAATLSSPEIEHIETFKIKKSGERVLTMKFNWGRSITIGQDGSKSVSLPGISMSFSDNQ